LRTPLNGILGYAQVLERSPNIPDKEQAQVQIIHECGAHLLGMINDILDLAKIEAGKLELSPKAVHLLSCLQNVVQICQVRATQKELELTYQVESELPEGVYLDEQRFRQVLFNLLGNAIKFTDQGTVTLRVAAIPVVDEPTMIHLHFVVADTGIGIAPQDFDKLFQVFGQVGDRQRYAEGSGLGLAISQTIVRLMGSEIQVQSERGKGSQFSFAIAVPLIAEPDMPRVRARAPIIMGYQGERRRLLVVDDRVDNRRVLVTLLEPLGFAITEVRDGQQALDHLRHQSFDLVITDLAMPVMDGYALLKHIRRSDILAHQKVIASSASVAQSDQQLALDAGANDFLPKPIDAAQLFDLLASALGLEWQYAGDDLGATTTAALEAGAIIIPSLEQLRSVHAAAVSGDFRSVRRQLEQLMAAEPDYEAFVVPLLALAKKLKTDEIRARLTQYVKGASHTQDEGCFYKP
ncbi:MAG: response regulator, partial [Cyanobacteria bacterium P01_H01_bin.121]